MAVQEKLLTAEEFANMPSDGKRYDLVKGRLVEVCRPKYIHGRLQTRFARHLDIFTDENKLGAVVTESGHILARNPDTVRGPDVAFIAQARLEHQEPTGFIPNGPDLAVEIVSPNDTTKEVMDKIKEYFRAGTRLVWVVYPEMQEVYVYAGSSTNVHIVDINGTLDGGDVLPGFALPLRDVFQDLGADLGVNQ